MRRNSHVVLSASWLWLSAGLMLGATPPALAQSNIRPTAAISQPRHEIPDLSEATALLESSVRAMYQNIEPGSDTSPNELLAYADLRALRLYTSALEVAGWSLEHSATEYQKHFKNGAYTVARGRISDPQAEIALERYRAYREATRTLLFRVRTTAVAVEHQVSFCPPEVSREWRLAVLPHLRDAIAATDLLFNEPVAAAGPTTQGRPTGNVIPTSGNGTLPGSNKPSTAHEITKLATYIPFDSEWRGQGRYLVVTAFGGPVRVKSIRFRSHENAFGLLGTSVQRDISVNQVVQPDRPVYIPCNRKWWSDVSDLQIDWENIDRTRRTFGTINIAETSPDDHN